MNDMETPRNGQDKIWAYFQNAQQESFAGSAPRIDYILRNVEQINGSATIKLLNIGSGNGYLEKRALDRHWEVFALDPDLETVERLIRSGVQAQNGRIENMPFEDRTFDIVIASEVLEHLDDAQLESGLKEVFRVLHDKGRFVGTVPYEENLDLNRVICPKCDEIFHRWGHHQSFGFRNLQALLESRHFIVQTIKRRAFVAFTGRGLAGFAKSCVRALLGMAGAMISSPNLFFIAKKNVTP